MKLSKWERLNLLSNRLRKNHSMPWGGAVGSPSSSHYLGPEFHKVPTHRSTYVGRVTWVVPMGTISRDLPQNLFFHLTSEIK